MQDVNCTGYFCYLLSPDGPFVDPDAGIGGLTCGTSNPVTAPDGSCALFVRSDTGAIWYWNGTSWVAVPSGGGGAGEILAYTTTGPTADGIFPSDLNSEAIAVKPGGTTFIWNSTTHVWDDS